MILTEKFTDTNPETNNELKNLYSNYIIVEKQRELDWTTYVFADSIEAKAEYIENKEMYAEMMFDKFYSLA